MDLIRALDAQPDQPRLVPFQRRFVLRSFADEIEVSALSAPRGAGKTMLLGRIAALALSPGSPIYHRGEEVIVVAGSIDQARLLARACAAAMATPVRWTGLTSSSAHRIVGVATCGTSLRVISSVGKRALGLGAENRLLLADEPASWEERAGALDVRGTEFLARQTEVAVAAHWNAEPGTA